MVTVATVLGVAAGAEASPNASDGTFAAATVPKPPEGLVVGVRSKQGTRRASLLKTDLDGRNERTLVLAASGVSLESPVWSPDASRIAFVRHVSTRGLLVTSSVHVVAAAGGSGRKLASAKMGLTNLAWSRTGESVAFGRNGIVYGRNSGCYAQKLSAVAVLTANAQTGRLRRVAGVATLALPKSRRPAFLYALDWGPGQRRLLLAEQRFSGGDCRTNDLSGDVLSSVTTAGRDRRLLVRAASIGDARYSLSGTQIAVTLGCALFVMDSLGGNRRKLVGRLEVDDGCHLFAGPSFRWLNGSELVYADRMAVHVVDTATGARRTIARSPLGQCRDYYCASEIVAVSREGKYIAVVDYNAGQASDADSWAFYVLTADGTASWSYPMPNLDYFDVYLRAP